MSALEQERARIGCAVVLVSVVELLLINWLVQHDALGLVLAFQVVPMYGLAYLFGALRE